MKQHRTILHAKILCTFKAVLENNNYPYMTCLFSWKPFDLPLNWPCANGHLSLFVCVSDTLNSFQLINFAFNDIDILRFCLLFLKLDELGDRREVHLVKLIKSFLSGKCYPAMPSMVEIRLDKTLLVSQSRTTMGTRRPSVFAANIYNQHLCFSSDSDETDN